MVRITGLEPACPCEHMDLNHTRLPIPPYPQNVCIFYTVQTNRGGLYEQFLRSTIIFYHRCYDLSSIFLKYIRVKSQRKELGKSKEILHHLNILITSI